MPEAPPGVHILGDFVFGAEADLAGAFIFESDGILSGLEVYGLAGDLFARAIAAKLRACRGRL